MHKESYSDSKLMLDSVSKIQIFDTPWPHGIIDNTISESLATSLIKEIFEKEVFLKTYKDKGNKTYSMSTCQVLPSLGPASKIFLTTVNSLEYRMMLQQIFDRDILTKPVRVDAWQYGSGDWLSPHVDKPEKIITQVLYLSSDWVPEDSGHFALMSSNNLDSIVKRIEPLYLRSVVFSPNDLSWHCVEKLSTTCQGRKSFTITYLQD